MAEQYAGVPIFHTDYTIPDDSDPPTAAAVNVALEALGDRTMWLAENKVTLSSVRTFSSTILGDGVVIPEGTIGAFVSGCGGGGGGGGGAGNPGPTARASGGGGGGGAIASGWQFVSISEVWTIHALIGQGGPGGAPGADGGDGGDTELIAMPNTLLARFSGAQGGLAGPQVNNPNGGAWGKGGAPTRLRTAPASPPLAEQNVTSSGGGLPGLADLHRVEVPQHGQHGSTNNVPATRTRPPCSPQGQRGGQSPVHNTAQVAAMHGGGSGGGGGAGAFGDGGDGGVGGDPNNGGEPPAPGNGASALPSTGGGGGGGGGCGGGTGAINNVPGGSGGNGGSGILYIVWVYRQGAAT